MKVSVDPDRCGGHGVCVSMCPDVFTLTEHGYAEVRQPDVPAELEEDVEVAASACPEWAIDID